MAKNNNLVNIAEFSIRNADGGIDIPATIAKFESVLIEIDSSRIDHSSKVSEALDTRLGRLETSYAIMMNTSGEGQMPFYEVHMDMLTEQASIYLSYRKALIAFVEIVEHSKNKRDGNEYFIARTQGSWEPLFKDFAPTPIA